MFQWIGNLFDGLFCVKGRPDRDKVGYMVGLIAMTSAFGWYTYQELLTEWFVLAYGGIVICHSLGKKYIESKEAAAPKGEGE